MSVLVLSEKDVRELLDMESCIEAMAEVLASLARGELFQPLRSIVRPPGAEGLFGLMPAYRGEPTATWALKEIAVVPSNPSRGLDTHMGGVLLHDGDTGELVAVMNASPVAVCRSCGVTSNIVHSASSVKFRMGGRPAKAPSCSRCSVRSIVSIARFSRRIPK